MLLFSEPANARPTSVGSATPEARAQPLFVLPAEGIDLAAVERSFIEQALEMARGNQTKAAQLLGINRFALRHRIDRYELQDRLKARRKPQRLRDVT